MNAGFRIDEPTAGLDPVASAALRDDLAGLAAKEGVTIFLNTHNLVEAEKLCQRVGVIREGNLLAVGSVADLRQRSGNPRAVIVGDGFNEHALADLRKNPDVVSAHVHDHRLTIEFLKPLEMAPFVSLLVNQGAQVEEVQKGQASLEDVFLTLMKQQQEVPA